MRRLKPDPVPDELIWKLLDASANRLANHLAEAPVLIMVTLDPARVAPVTPPGANVFPAVQNLLLAARALGLGATLTTVYRTHEAEVKQLLGIPEPVETMALIPIGYPVGKFGPTARIPAENVPYWDKWGEEREREGPEGAGAPPRPRNPSSRGPSSGIPSDSRAAASGISHRLTAAMSSGRTRLYERRYS